MLNYIECDRFTQRRINFHKKLNIVAGDSKSTNSIGKSTLLKIIDFIYGGETFLKHGHDTTDTLGHHTYYFSLTFGNIEFHLSRNTQTPRFITYYPPDGPTSTVEVNDYTNWLRENYCPTINNMSFRKIVSPVSRVWGKGAPDVTKPLHSHPSDSGVECIDYLISIFERYGAISDLSIRLANATAERAALNKAFSKQILSKVTKSQYTSNSETINRANKQLDFIRDQLSTLAISINELIDGEVLSLKSEKDQLVRLRTLLMAEIDRTTSNLESRRSVSAKAFDQLVDIIPDINISKLEKIESFHNGLLKVLNKQIKARAGELTVQLGSVNAEIEKYNSKIASRISNIGNPTHLVDAIADLTLQISKSQTENRHYDQALELKKLIKELSVGLEDKKNSILADIQTRLNTDVATLVEYIYEEKRTPPKLKLSPKNYIFSLPNDTGTGKAYASLISLDASILRHTNVPYLIHDSFLFKNIEDKAIINMLYVYEQLRQQSFIALDGSVLEATEAKSMVEYFKVIELSSSKLLYTADWRAKTIDTK